MSLDALGSVLCGSSTSTLTPPASLLGYAEAPPQALASCTFQLSLRHSTIPHSLFSLFPGGPPFTFIHITTLPKKWAFTVKNNFVTSHADLCMGVSQQSLPCTPRHGHRNNVQREVARQSSHTVRPCSTFAHSVPTHCARSQPGFGARRHTPQHELTTRPHCPLSLPLPSTQLHLFRLSDFPSQQVITSRIQPSNCSAATKSAPSSSSFNSFSSCSFTKSPHGHKFVAFPVFFIDHVCQPEQGLVFIVL